MFSLYTILIAVILGVGITWALSRANDTLHPMVYLLPMCGFVYVYMPVSLYRSGEMLEYFSMAQVNSVQLLNLVCIGALVAGIRWGSGPVRRDSSRTDLHNFMLRPEVRQTMKTIGITLGVISLLAYFYRISTVGGFYAAYDDPKGGGWAQSGYIRELDLLVVPSIVLIYMSCFRRRVSVRTKLLIALFSTPLLLHGLLSARRGPTFLALATLIGGWYLVQNRRPRLSQVVVGGSIIGLLLLVLVTFRGQIYLGSSFFTSGPAATELVEKSLEYSTKGTFGNEFMMGLYIVENADENDIRYWGRRYMTQLFVRPIPSAFWPTKYEDVGMEALKVNAGLLGMTDLQEEHPMIPPGSAPGFVASAYVEWGWGAPVFLLGLGWLYGMLWRRQLTYGGIWTVAYIGLLSTSVFFVAQAFLAVLFRLLVMFLPTYLVWKFSIASRSRPAPAYP